ncbi:MAG: phosphoglycerate kinase, partial [Candidatus Veblenbacteria bacterium]|nr:phosphoglycerate kinase [Candidatus Veblenbacteria bacterium]
RVDANVPMQGKRVVDDTRLREIIPTLRFLQRQGARVILISHLGRPGGKAVPVLSLKPVGWHLGKLLRQPVKVLPLSMKPEAIRKEATTGLVLLENIRFDKGEDANSLALARILARLGQVYVNEAFSFSHRGTASMVGLPRKLPAYAGFQLVHEVAALERVSKIGKKPVVAIIGGAKISDKLPVIVKLLPRLTAVLVGGGVANTLLQAKGYRVGKSLVEASELVNAKRLFKRAGKKLVLPVDVVVDKVGTRRKEGRLRTVTQVATNERIMDIGTETCRLYATYIKRAQTVFWSGPLGVVEEPLWRHGSLALGRLLAARARGRSYVLAGGGETAGFCNQHGLVFDYISTGGSAMLAFLANAPMPGLAAVGYRRAGKS